MRTSQTPAATRHPVARCRVPTSAVRRAGARRLAAGLIATVGLVALVGIVTFVGALAGATTASAQDGGSPGGGGDYVTTTTAAGRSLDVSAFAPECIRDTPVISYTIVPIGFVPDSNTAELVIRDSRGEIIGTSTVDSLSGRIVYPGATVDAEGNTTDWPGWMQTNDGSWVQDPSDAHLREGVTIEVTVSPPTTATATVAYPPADSPCANPPGTTPCEPGDPGCDPCVPGQNGDDNPADDCALPGTGQSVSAPLAIGTILVGTGLAFGLAARRRRAGDPATAA